MSSFRQRLRSFLARHLYSYLAVVVAVAGGLTVLFARDELWAAVDGFDPRWIAPILLLTLANYALRFLKWQGMLMAVGVRIPWVGSARVFLACFAMVVTPFRLGEAYKLVFLKRLYNAPMLQTGPVLILERLTDAAAVLALGLWYFDRQWGLPLVSGAAILGALLLGVVGSQPRPRHILLGILGRLPFFRDRAVALDQALQHNAALLRPRILAPALLLSLLAWWSECMGLALVLRGLAAPLAVGDATWVYALATALGNLTFLPGGLGSTEASLVLWLRSLDLSNEIALAATLLVRVATLWFAVLLGLFVSLVGRRALHWQEVQAEAQSMEEAPAQEELNRRSP